MLTQSCCWLVQFLTQALNTWISSKFSLFNWICLLFILLILMGVELPLCLFVTLSYNRITCFLESNWVQDSFVLFQWMYHTGNDRIFPKVKFQPFISHQQLNREPFWLTRYLNSHQSANLLRYFQHKFQQGFYQNQFNIRRIALSFTCFKMEGINSGVLFSCMCISLCITQVYYFHYGKGLISSNSENSFVDVYICCSSSYHFRAI